MKTNHPTDKQLQPELLRCLAILLVVLVHVTSEPLHLWREDLGAFFPIYTLAYTLGHLGVPIFLMISGALLCNQKRNISLKKLYGRMIPRILLPLIFWGYIFSLMEQWFSLRTFTGSMLLTALLHVLNGDSWTHLWYLYMLIGLYLLLPILRFTANGLKRSQKRYLIGVLLFLGSVLPTLNRIEALDISLYQPAPLCYITMFLLGYFLADYAESRESETRSGKTAEKPAGHPALAQTAGTKIIAAGSLSLIILVVYCFLADVQSKTAYQQMAQYHNLFIILTSAAIFYAVWKYCGSCPYSLIRRWVMSLGECSFGIYLLHPVILNLAYKALSITPDRMHPLLSLLLLWLPVILGCHLLVWLMKQVPIIKKMVGFR